MMFRTSIYLTILLLLACSPEPAKEQDNDVVLLREIAPGISEKCLEEFRVGGFDALPQDVRECFVMEESKRWSGLWLDQFEGSRFCAAPEADCTFETEGERVWLSFAPEIEPTRKYREEGDRLYRIEFVGRQTKNKGAFGHGGLFDKEIVVEKLIRLERVPSG